MLNLKKNNTCIDLNAVENDCNIEQLQKNIIESIVSKINYDLELIARYNSIPPIKGEITNGKCKWRGLKICNEIIALEQYYWIEQRGKLIGKKLKVSNIIKT